MVQLYHNRNVNKNSLLFKVDYTRAKSGLIISYSGEKTELLPDNVDNLYIEREIK